MRGIAPAAMVSTKRFDSVRVRGTLIKRGYLAQNVVPYSYRLFDRRWLYWEPDTKLLDEERSEYFAQAVNGNLWFTRTTRARKQNFYLPLVTSALADLNVIEANVQLFPLLLTAQQSPLLGQVGWLRILVKLRSVTSPRLTRTQRA